eukprot:COSAG02_NODE_11668_length_1677_cov_1.294043_3_plen_30_part_01
MEERVGAGAGAGAAAAGEIRDGDEAGGTPS